MRSRGFTLIELLVVIAIIALLIGILLPVLSSARQRGKTVKCLSNIRGLQMAQMLYSDAYKGRFIDAGLGHGGVDDIDLSWPVQLRTFSGNSLALRSPVDDSPFWPESQEGLSDGLSLDEVLERVDNGEDVNLGELARWTSYGLNSYLARSVAPSANETFDRMDLVQRPTLTIQFIMMTQGLTDESEAYATSDHVHPDDWSNGPGGAKSAPLLASFQMDVAAHGGEVGSPNARANYGYIDGHAETHQFSDVYTSHTDNRFHPEHAR
jgi:prepilin-type N-terminal cleavage/methylation domain-containing protein/prepilin-type processing-associated H-X9-DG protein